MGLYNIQVTAIMVGSPSVTSAVQILTNDFINGSTVSIFDNNSSLIAIGSFNGSNWNIVSSTTLTGDIFPSNVNIDYTFSNGITETTLANLGSAQSAGPNTQVQITDYGRTIATSDGGRWRLARLVLAWGDKPPANLVPPGTGLRVTDLNNASFFSDGTNWRPDGKQTIYHKNGLVASPLATLSGVTAGLFAIPQILIPAGMITPNSKIEIQYLGKKTNANGSLGWNTQLGTAASASDSSISGVYSGATAGDVLIACAVRFGTDTTKALAMPNGNDFNNTNGSTQLYDRTTNINTAANMYVTIGVISANALDSFSLTSVRVSYEA